MVIRGGEKGIASYYTYFGKKNMGVKKHLLDAQAKLPGGRIVTGPVTTSDDKTYHFKTQAPGSDFYLYLIRDDNGWYESGGNEAEHPQEIVDQIGAQIDDFLSKNA